ncbi:beta-lactamase/transpeptidase-like protein [Trichoderma sp. SZMC 28015]
MASEDTTQADYLAKIDAILQESVAAGVTGLSAAITSARGHWTFVAGVSDLESQQPITSTHLFGVGSITKVFTAVVIFQLIEEGKLQLTDTVSKLLDPEIYRDIDNAAEANVDLLLSHETGIDNWEDDPAWIKAGRGSKLNPAHKWTKVEPLDYIRRPRLTAPERGNYYYANTNYELLGFMIEKITQNTAEAEIRRRILGPLGMDHTFLEGFEEQKQGTMTKRYHFATKEYREAAGINAAFPELQDGKLIDCTASNLSVEWTAGGMVSTPSDLVKFATALRDGKLLSAESLAIMKMWRPTTSETSEMGHGLFRMRDSEKNGWLGHFGGVLGFTAALWWKEEGDCAISVLSNVGVIHSGDVPSSGAHVVIKSKIRELAAQLAAL